MNSLQLTELKEEKNSCEPAVAGSGLQQAPSRLKQSPPRLYLKTICCSVRLVIVHASLIVILAGLSYILYYYFIRQKDNYERPMVPVTGFFFLLYGLQFFLCLRELKNGFFGRITKKPSSRPVKPNFWFELGVNGKYYLWRMYSTELLELAYQLFNYRIFACSMRSEFLIFFCLAIGTECSVRAWNRRNLAKQISNKEKLVELVLDLLVDMFALCYPLLIIHFDSEIPFGDAELISIISVPLLCLFMRMRVMFYEEVRQLVYNDEVHKKTEHLTLMARKQQRRSSFAQRHSIVEKVQNQHCTKATKTVLLVLATVNALFFLTLASVQAVNTLTRPVSTHFLKYCTINTPSCDSWFEWKENCLVIQYLSTQAYHPMDKVMEKFSSSTATQIIEMSFLNNTSVLQNKFPVLKRLLLYKPSAKMMVSLNQWPKLIYFGLFHANQMEEIKDCCGPETPVTLINLENAPKLKIKVLDIPHLDNFVASEVQLPNTVHLPSVTTLHLRNMNLTELPSSLKNRKYNQLSVAGNNLESLESSAEFIVDIRYNQLTQYNEKATFSYAYGNKVCPENFNCKPYCHPKCKNKYYYPDKLNTCVYQCVEYCGLSSACKKIFK